MEGFCALVPWDQRRLLLVSLLSKQPTLKRDVYQSGDASTLRPKWCRPHGHQPVLVAIPVRVAERDASTLPRLPGTCCHQSWLRDLPNEEGDDKWYLEVSMLSNFKVSDRSKLRFCQLWVVNEGHSQDKQRFKDLCWWANLRWKTLHFQGVQLWEGVALTWHHGQKAGPDFCVECALSHPKRPPQPWNSHIKEKIVNER